MFLLSTEQLIPQSFEILSRQIMKDAYQSNAYKRFVPFLSIYIYHLKSNNRFPGRLSSPNENKMYRLKLSHI